MSTLPRHLQSVRALALQSPPALATFTPTLRCVRGNAEFARLTGRDPDRVAGLAWRELFPDSGPHHLGALIAVLDRRATTLALELPGVRSYRRGRDVLAGRPDRDWAGRSTRPALYPATVHLIDVPGAEPLLGLTGRHRVSIPWSTDDVGGLWADASAATVSARIDAFLRRGSHGPDWVVLLAAAVDGAAESAAESATEPTVEPAGRPGQDGVDLLGLTSYLSASFRNGDCLSVLDGRWPVLACPVDGPAEAGPLADRFRAAVRDGSCAGQAESSVEIRMAVGRRAPGRAAELLARLGAPDEPITSGGLRPLVARRAAGQLAAWSTTPARKASIRSRWCGVRPS